MAGSFTDYVEKGVLDTLFGSNSVALSTGNFGTLYIGLYESTATPGDTLSALTSGECLGSTYARKSFTNSTATWCNTTLGTGIKKLKTAIVFTTAAGSDWGIIGSFAILDTDSTSAGNALCWSTLTGGNKTINTGDSVSITTDLTITLG